VNGTIKALSIIGDNLTIGGINLSSAIVPLGSIIPWAKNFTNTPSLPATFIECNGQIINDVESIYNGQLAPDLNITNRFLRGSNSSGSIGGSETHVHAWDGASSTLGNIAHGSQDRFTTTVNHLPPYYEIVWIMRIK
jgi:hypothetical protein